MNSVISTAVQDEQDIKQRLQIHGIPYDAIRERMSRNMACYAVEVSELEVVSIRERLPQAWVAHCADHAISRKLWRSLDHHELQQLQRTTRRVARLAVRVTYVLELRHALIMLYIGSGGKVVVGKIRTEPQLNTAAPDPIHNQGGLSFVPTAKQRPKLGMDPEFLLVDLAGEVVFAEQYLNRTGKVGCDAALVDGIIRYPLAELRPAPRVEPQELLVELQAALQLAASKLPREGLSWLAGGMPRAGLPLGGHIHFSGLPLTSEVLRVLDNYLALPILMIEDDRSLARRPQYGYLGDFRKKPYGFEYRVLPSWIGSPRIAAGVLSLARIIADHHEKCLRRPLSDEKFQRWFYQGDKEKLANMVKSIWDDLEQTAGYRTYQHYLEPFKAMVHAGKSWDSDMDMRSAWKLTLLA